MTTIYFATDHAGYELKQAIMEFVARDLGYEVVDCGAMEHDIDDDYTTYVQQAAAAVAADPEKCKAIIFGGSGQGEAMLANRFKGIRAAVYYGSPAATQTDAAGEVLDIITSSRVHNDANILSLGARFITTQEAQQAVKTWLATPFSGAPRHVRRNQAPDELA